MKIYLVGECDYEGFWVRSAHRTKAGALKAWNEIRLGMLADAQRRLADAELLSERCCWQEDVDALSSDDPAKVNEGRCEKPYMREIDLVD